MSNVVIASPEVILQVYEEASQLWYNTITEHQHWSVPKLGLVGKKGKPDGWCRARRHRLEGIMEDLMQNGKLPSDEDMQFCRRNLCKQAWHRLDPNGKRMCLHQYNWRESFSTAVAAYEQWSQKYEKSGVRRRSSESTVDGLIQLTIPQLKPPPWSCHICGTT